MGKIKDLVRCTNCWEGSIGSRLSRVTATVNVPVAKERDRSFKVVSSSLLQTGRAIRKI